MKKIVSLMLALCLLLSAVAFARTIEEQDAAYDAALNMAVAGDVDTAYAELQKLVDEGYVRALYAIGYYLDTGAFNGGVPAPESAVPWWLRASEAGDSKAWQALGHYYAHDAELKDFAKSEEYLIKAAEAGQIGAMYNLGIHYKNGDFNGGVPDPVRAKMWYAQAAEAGDDGALGSLVELCVYGVEDENGEILLAPDHQKLFEILLNAYERGSQNTVVYDWLGWLYAGNSEVIEADYLKAYEVYMAGAQLGSGYCMAQLGAIYRDARLGVADTVAAEAWFMKAVEAEYLPAQEMLDSLRGE